MLYSRWGGCCACGVFGFLVSMPAAFLCFRFNFVEGFAVLCLRRFWVSGLTSLRASPFYAFGVSGFQVSMPSAFLCFTFLSLRRFYVSRLTSLRASPFYACGVSRFLVSCFWGGRRNELRLYKELKPCLCAIVQSLVGLFAKFGSVGFFALCCNDFYLGVVQMWEGVDC